MVARFETDPPRKAELMPLDLLHRPRTSRLFLACAGALGLALSGPAAARAASCKTQSQMTAAERDALVSISRSLATDVQTGNVQALKANTIPAVASDFSGIEGAVTALRPNVQQATITVDNLYSMDSTTEPAGSQRTDFFCGSPVVVLDFTDLPPGQYALAIVHATGVPKPEQIGLVLAQGADHRWMLGGFFPKPLTEDGHDGLWYWVAARKFAQKNQNWGAWFYYRSAAYYLTPVAFMSSPNLEKLTKEEDQVKPDNLPGAKPLIINSMGSVFQVTAIDTTSELGALDLDVQYLPEGNQIAQLHDPPAARKQVTEVMTALLALHPELREAFHGIWVHANQGSDSIFSLELPMDQIAAAPVPTSVSAAMAR
jgi:hypothetical protein